MAASPVDSTAPDPYDGDLALTWGRDRLVLGGPGVSSFPIIRQTMDRPMGGAWLRLRDAGLLAGAPGRSLPDAWET